MNAYLKKMGQMRPEELIQCMRTISMATVRMRLMELEFKHPAGYAAVCNLFKPVKLNKKK